MPEFPAIGEIEEMWRSGHLGDEDWDADIEALEGARGTKHRGGTNGNFRR